MGKPVAAKRRLPLPRSASSARELSSSRGGEGARRDAPPRRMRYLSPCAMRTSSTTSVTVPNCSRRCATAARLRKPGPQPAGHPRPVPPWNRSRWHPAATEAPWSGPRPEVPHGGEACPGSPRLPAPRPPLEHPTGCLPKPLLPPSASAEGGMELKAPHRPPPSPPEKKLPVETRGPRKRPRRRRGCEADPAPSRPTKELA